MEFEDLFAEIQNIDESGLGFKYKDFVSFLKKIGSVETSTGRARLKARLFFKIRNFKAKDPELHNIESHEMWKNMDKDIKMFHERFLELQKIEAEAPPPQEEAKTEEAKTEAV